MQFKRLSIPLLLLGIIFVGLGLRLYCLTKDDIWYDESVTIMEAKMTLPDMVRFTLGTIDVTNFPPVYFILMKGWIDLFGDSPAAVRMSSVLFGVLTIVAIFGIGKLLFNEKYGLVVALLMAVSPFDIYYSQETRAYALQVLLLCISVYFFIQALLEDKKNLWLLYGIIQLFAIYVHFFSTFIWFSLIFFHAIYAWRKSFSLNQILKHSLGHGIVLIGLFPILIIRITHYFPKLISWVPPFEVPFYRHTLMQLLFGNTHPYSKLVYSLGIAIFVLSSFISIYYLLKYWRKNYEKSSTGKLDLFSTGILCWILFLCPVIIFTIVSLTVTPIYVPNRYLIIVLPGFLLLLTQVLFLIPWRTIGMAILSVLVILSLISVKHNHLWYGKIGMKSIAQFIQINGNKNDVILFFPGYHAGSFQYYFKGQIRYNDDSKENPPTKRIWVVQDKWSLTPNELQWVYSNIVNKYGNPVRTEYLPPHGIKVCLFEKK